MSTDRILERTHVVRVGLHQALAFFSDAQNLETITPPWLRFRILEAPEELRKGSRLEYRLRLFGVPIHWRTASVQWRPPFGFTDVQLSGPYPHWEHMHHLRQSPEEPRSVIGSFTDARSNRSPACSHP